MNNKINEEILTALDDLIKKNPDHPQFSHEYLELLFLSSLFDEETKESD